MGRPLFIYDFSSPYAYLAALRVDEVLPVVPHWRPISFGFLLRATGRVPWSLGPQREEGMRDCEQRARARGVPPIRWPPGWPADSYSLVVLRGALVAEEHGRLREFSLAAYRHVFGQGEVVLDPDVVAAIGAEAGVPPDAVRDGVQRPQIKGRLQALTEDALARGVVGIPTVIVGDDLFWGDDRLEEAAERLLRGSSGAD